MSTLLSLYHPISSKWPSEPSASSPYLPMQPARQAYFHSSADGKRQMMPDAFTSGSALSFSEKLLTVVPRNILHGQVRPFKLRWVVPHNRLPQHLRHLVLPDPASLRQRHLMDGLLGVVGIAVIAAPFGTSPAQPRRTPFAPPAQSRLLPFDRIHSLHGACLRRLRSGPGFRHLSCLILNLRTEALEIFLRIGIPLFGGLAVPRDRLP